MKAPDDREAALSRYREGPKLLESVVTGVQCCDLDAVPQGGGWTIRQIIHHVVDGDDLWKLGIKMAMGNEQGEFTLGWYWSLSQMQWADRWAYSQRSVDVSLSLFKAMRAHIVELLECVPEAWTRSVGLRTPDGKIERVPIGFVIQMQADHVLHHVERIRCILRDRGAA